MTRDDSDNLILCTGATGYVGTVLVPHLVGSGYKVRTLDTQVFGNAIADTPNVESVKGDICDRETVKKALEDCSAIIHLAGIVTDDLVDMNRGLALKVNVFATQQLCELAVEAGVQRFIYASSSSVYGSTVEPATEETRCAPETFYALTKLVAEQAVLGFKDKICVTAVRSATCFGPAPRMRLDTIVNVFCKQAYFCSLCGHGPHIAVYDGSSGTASGPQAGVRCSRCVCTQDNKVITVHDGTQWRSNIHVQDAAEFYGRLLATEAPKINGEVFNIVEHSRTAWDIAVAVIATFYEWGYAVTHQVDASKKDRRQYKMNSEKAKRVLGWEPKRSIYQGIRDNIDFFRSGGITDPNDSLFYNTKRMEKLVKGTGS